MKLTYTELGQVFVVSLTGRLDGAAPEQVAAELKGNIASHPCLVFDCSGLEYMDSTGLGCLLMCLRLALQENGDVRLVSLSPKVRMLLELTRVNKVFRCFPDLESALESFRDSHQLNQEW